MFAIIFSIFLACIAICYVIWSTPENPDAATPPVTSTVVITITTTTPVAACPPEMNCPPLPSLDY